MTYSWQILNFVTRDEVNGDGASLENAVVSIHWKRSGIDSGGNTAAINGYTSLVASDVDASSFITFADLTEDTVTGWLDTANSVRLSDYNAKINTKIAKAGETTRAVPWS
ncbi:MAG: DUF7936 family protein [Methylophagaceae bacterium]|jgi:hypothetical protein|tara:strand:- start:3054 stop:3383 length:330 start_codon:yes stop_codon:yes gene_type:complete